MSSTVIEPGDRRRWPTNTFWTFDSSSAAGRIEEPPGGVRDRRVVVADLVHDDAAQIEPDLLLADARHGDLALVGLERERPDLRHARHDEGAAPGDDPEPEPATGPDPRSAWTGSPR
jgi:hypothetical protein